MKKKRAEWKSYQTRNLEKELQLQEKLAKRGSHYDASDVFQPISEVIEETSGKNLENLGYSEKLDDISVKVCNTGHLDEEDPPKSKIVRDPNSVTAFESGEEKVF